MSLLPWLLLLGVERMAQDRVHSAKRLVLSSFQSMLLMGAAYCLIPLGEQVLHVKLTPYLTLFPAVVLAALLLGLTAALVAIATAAVLADLLTMEPIGQLQIASREDRIFLLLFSLLSLLLVWVCQYHSRRRERTILLKSRRALYESNSKLEAALAGMSDAVFIVDTAGRFIHVNDAFASFHRIDPHDASLRSNDELARLIELHDLTGCTLPAHEWCVARGLRGESGADLQLEVRRRDTGERWIGSYNFAAIHDRAGALVGAVVVARDITAQRAAELALLSSEKRYRTAFQTSLDLMTITRLSDGCFIDVNRSFVEVIGYTREEVVGKTSFELGIWSDVHDRDELLEQLHDGCGCRDLQVQFRCKDGRLLWSMLSAALIDVEGELCILVVARDLSEARMAEQEIRHLAFFDPLTGLANRRLLMEQLRKSIAQCGRSHQMGALLFIDLDNFKTLNDTLGHHVGDLLLHEVAQRMLCCVRKVDTVGRLGGDEFVVMLEDLGNNTAHAASRVKNIAEKILCRIDQPFHFDEHEYSGTCSIGITLYGQGSENENELLQQADLAMYQAKNAGRNAVRFFAPELQKAVSDRVALEEDLRQGIQHRQFELNFQPQYAGGRLVGAEALLRWRHPQRGLLAPGEFIALAEETRQILPLGSWVIDAACEQAARWQHDALLKDVTMSINISAAQLRRQDFVDSVLASMIASGVDFKHIKLEITESMLAENLDDVIEKMRALRRHGVGLSLDDFGTGYSSLSYLKRLPLDELKIDRGFVQDIEDDPGNAAIVRTIVSLSHAIGLPVVAEGVEREAQHKMLLDLGCDACQGFYYSHPLSGAAFEKLLVH